MLVHSESYILISNDIENEVARLKTELRGYRVVEFIRDEFKIDDAKLVLQEAYISESNLKFLILGASSFNHISQNSLLKLLEEPPRNIRFIVITSSKSNLLPTILSRLPIKKGKMIYDKKEVTINLSKIDYAEIFQFLKSNDRIKKAEAKELLEAIYYKATVVDGLVLSLEQLELFESSYKLLELNSRVQSILATVLMSFVEHR